MDFFMFQFLVIRTAYLATGLSGYNASKDFSLVTCPSSDKNQPIVSKLFNCAYFSNFSLLSHLMMTADIFVSASAIPTD